MYNSVLPSLLLQETPDLGANRIAPTAASSFLWLLRPLPPADIGPGRDSKELCGPFRTARWLRRAVTGPGAHRECELWKIPTWYIQISTDADKTDSAPAADQRSAFVSQRPEVASP